MSFLCHQGKFIPADRPLLTADNRGYRYGDGVFETMRIHEGRILLRALHFERLWQALALLEFDLPPAFNPEKLEAETLELCRMNRCEQSARVRLSVNSGNGNLNDPAVPNYIIECGEAERPAQWNETGLEIGLFTLARKSCDPLANLKSANFLPYVAAARHAVSQGLDDCLVLNSQGHIADSTVANVFILQEGRLLTPSLDQGCVAGVMRRWILGRLQGNGYDVEESVCPVTCLETAGEVFLTNAVRGLRWVGGCGSSRYVSDSSRRIFRELMGEWLST